MKIKIDGIAFFYIGFVLVLALLIVGLYSFLGLAGVILGTICMILGIYLYQARFYIDIDTTEDEEDDDEENDVR